MRRAIRSTNSESGSSQGFAPATILYALCRACASGVCVYLFHVDVTFVVLAAVSYSLSNVNPNCGSSPSFNILPACLNVVLLGGIFTVAPSSSSCTVTIWMRG